RGRRPRPAADRGTLLSTAGRFRSREGWAYCACGYVRNRSLTVAARENHPARGPVRYDGEGVLELRSLFSHVVAGLCADGLGADGEVRRATHRRYSVRPAGTAADRRGTG